MLRSKTPKIMSNLIIDVVWLLGISLAVGEIYCSQRPLNFNSPIPLVDKFRLMSGKGILLLTTREC